MDGLDGSDIGEFDFDLADSDSNERLRFPIHLQWRSPHSRSIARYVKDTAAAAALSVFKYVLEHAGHDARGREYLVSVPLPLGNYRARTAQAKRTDTMVGGASHDHGYTRVRSKRIKLRQYVLNDEVLKEMGFDHASGRFSTSSGFSMSSRGNRNRARDEDLPDRMHSVADASDEDAFDEDAADEDSDSSRSRSRDTNSDDSDRSSNSRQKDPHQTGVNLGPLLGLIYALNMYHVLANQTMEGILEALRTIPSNSVKCVLTSPPWNLVGLRTSAGRSKQPRVKYDIWPDNVPEEEYRRWQVAVLNELHRIIMDDGVILYNHRDRHIDGKTSSPLLDIIQQSKCHYHQTLTLDHPTAASSSSTWIPETHEYMYVLTKGPLCSELQWKSADKQSGCRTVWHTQSSPAIKKTAKVKGTIAHPCPFDMDVTIGLLRRATREGDIVLDPFAGSGTTLLAAEQLKCNFIGFDISDNYHSIWSKRRARAQRTRLCSEY